MAAIRKGCVLGVLLLLWSGLAQAQGDDRFQILLHFEAEGVAPPIQEQVKQALPMLWQRIMPQATRLKEPRDISAMSLLRSIHPNGLSSTIVFNEDRVWSFLESRQLPHLREYPHVYMSLTVLDSLGRHQTPNEVELSAFLQEQMVDLGMAQDTHAPLLRLQVQWLNDVQYDLSYQSQSESIAKRVQNNPRYGLDPMEQLKEQLLAALLDVREQHVWHPVTATQVREPDGMAQGVVMKLHVMGSSALSDQVTLEQALSQDERVVSLVPVMIGAEGRDYQLTLKHTATDWLAVWFAQRGMRATPDVDGWLVQ